MQEKIAERCKRKEDKSSLNAEGCWKICAEG
jgi:hypothetical protein